MSNRQAAVVGVFETEEALLRAVRAARAGGMTIRDAYTPYAVHGLDEAMGLPPTRLGRVCFLFGAAGATLAMGFQLWASAVNWPANIGGKSFAAVPALIPIAFELTILFAALGTVLTFFVRARLHPGRAAEPPAPGVTDDRFALSLDPPGADPDAARRILTEAGAVAVQPINGSTRSAS
jgi:hypothetical protein